MEQGWTVHRVPLAASCTWEEILSLSPDGGTALDTKRLSWLTTGGCRLQGRRTPGEEFADFGMTLAACETDEQITIAVTKMDGTRDETAARTSLAARWKPQGLMSPIRLARRCQ